MLLQHRRAFAHLILTFDITVVAAAVLIGERMGSGEYPTLGTFLAMVAVGAAIWTAIADRLDVYQSRRTGGWVREYWSLLKSLVLTLGVALLGRHALVGPSGFDPVWALGVSLLAMASTRILLRGGLAMVRRRGLNTRNTVFVGRGRSGRLIAQDYLRNPSFGMVVLGGLEFSGEEGLEPLANLEPLGNSGRLPELVKSQAVDEVVVCPSDGVWTTEVRSLLRFCETVGLNVRFAPDFLGILPDRTSITATGGVPTYEIHAGFEGSRWLGVKRLIDICASALAVIMLAPILLTIAIIIKLTSKGDVFFRQTRVGLNGRHFTMLKFRSMVNDAERIRQELAKANEQSGPVFKMKNDPRITRIGRVLRKYSLDELPQLFNVLRGDMSIVGPRPPIPSEVEEYDWWQRRRLSVRPGLTCIWQVSGRNNISFDRWMEMDLQYIDGWSLRMDLQIMAKTVTEVLRGGGM